MSYGIPIVYYGTESRLSGGADPDNREVYDPFRQSADLIMEKHIKILNEVRRNHQTYDYDPEFKSVDSNFMAFTKGSDILVVVTTTDNVH